MKDSIRIDSEIGKRNDLLITAKRLFLKQGYHNTSIRQIVKKANSSIGNFYFYYHDKQTVLKIVAKELIEILRNQIVKVKDLGLSPEIGFAFDFKLGYIKTLEESKLSKIWYIIQNTPEIHKYSLENKKIRLQTFFGDRIPAEELKLIATAIQGISDAIRQESLKGELENDPIELSNKIIEYSLRLLGFSQEEVNHTIKKVDELIKEKNVVLKELEDNYNIR